MTCPKIEATSENASRSLIIFVFDIVTAGINTRRPTLSWTDLRTRTPTQRSVRRAWTVVLLVGLALLARVLPVDAFLRAVDLALLAHHAGRVLGIAFIDQHAAIDALGVALDVETGLGELHGQRAS